MLTILNLFGKSPFAPLQKHMEKVAECVFKLPDFFKALEEGDKKSVNQIAEQISELEHQADLIKNEIRNHLPKTVFLPMDRGNLLEILTLQDRIADQVEDIAVVLTLKPLHLMDSFKQEFYLFLKKNLDSFKGTYRIIQELHELLESSFGGAEAERVRSMIDKVAFQEHEVDVLQRKLIRKLIDSEKELTFVTYDLWQRAFIAIASLSNISEKLAFCIRTTLDLK